MNLLAWILDKIFTAPFLSTKYICPKCGTTERIPNAAIKACDKLDPERTLYGPAHFQCEKCGYDYMKPVKSQPDIV